MFLWNLHIKDMNKIFTNFKYFEKCTSQILVLQTEPWLKFMSLFTTFESCLFAFPLFLLLDFLHLFTVRRRDEGVLVCVLISLCFSLLLYLSLHSLLVLTLPLFCSFQQSLDVLRLLQHRSRSRSDQGQMKDTGTKEIVITIPWCTWTATKHE